MTWKARWKCWAYTGTCKVLGMTQINLWSHQILSEESLANQKTTWLIYGPLEVANSGCNNGFNSHMDTLGVHIMEGLVKEPSWMVRAGKVQFGSVQSPFCLNLNLNLLLQGWTEPEPELILPELVLLGSELVQNWFKPELQIHFFTYWYECVIMCWGDQGDENRTQAWA